MSHVSYTCSLSVYTGISLSFCPSFLLFQPTFHTTENDNSRRSNHENSRISTIYVWLGSHVVRTLNLRSMVSVLPIALSSIHCIRPSANCPGTCASVTKQYNLILAKGQPSVGARKVTASLASQLSIHLQLQAQNPGERDKQMTTPKTKIMAPLPPTCHCCGATPFLSTHINDDQKSDEYLSKFGRFRENNYATTLAADHLFNQPIKLGRW